MNNGKFVIIAIAVVGVAMSTFAWWVRWSRSQIVLNQWGYEAAVAIRNGEGVELLELTSTPPSDPAEEISIHTVANTQPTETVTVWVTNTRDISKTPGLLHAKHHLLHVKGLDWEAPRDEGCDPDWSVAMRFKHPDHVATMLFDLQCNRAYLVERNVEVSMAPIAKGIKTFLGELTSDGSSDQETIANEGKKNADQNKPDQTNDRTTDSVNVDAETQARSQ